MFVKNIITGNISIPEKLRISLFKPPGLRRIIKDIPLDNYVLGVGYPEGDYQICISGRKKKDELLTEAMSREMFEELSLFPNRDPILEFVNGKNHFYKINITDTKLVNRKFMFSTEYDTKDRVIGCIYGNQADILHYLDHVKLDKYNCDCITHIWTDNVKNLLNYVKR